MYRPMCWAVLVGIAMSACVGPEHPSGSGDSVDPNAREITVTDSAYAGSSVNVVAGSRQTLYTSGDVQYAGFYNAQGQLTLGKRRLGEDDWTLQNTGYTAAVQDAHNTISLIVDGSGYLHVAWGHHNIPLQYAVGRAPGALALSEPKAMVGEGESSVTYPQLYRTNQGDLLFLYREGGSGDGRVVLNRYDLEQRRWYRLQDNLIDGERQRSAYWDMTIDASGGLHLAWNWRETPDVASNHDLMYAHSPDGGRTWLGATGKRYELPITAAHAEVAAGIDQGSNLMNPPAVAVDRQGRPYISSYWSESEGERPRFHVVYRRDSEWRIAAGPMAGEDFELKGWGTKRPPISRAALLIESGADHTRTHLIYRDDSQGERVVLASAGELGTPHWEKHFLTRSGVGAWEPSIDPVAWQRLGEAHLLLQTVHQVDGDDESGSGAPATPLRELIWRASPAGASSAP